MKTIFDPANRWVGAESFVIVAGNKRPVTIDDALNIFVDSGPVTVDVLANDFDPEAGPLTLVSASAALGTAVVAPDDTVTYTPFPGVSGFDTVVYTVEDDVGQTRDGQINITILEPQLSVDEVPGNTLEITAETGALEITVTAPAEFAGTYQTDTADLVSGPINLVPPSVSGTIAAGEVLTASDGLWIYDVAAGGPTQSWQWQRGGMEISGATAQSYTVAPEDFGLGLSVVETQTDSAGQRLAEQIVIAESFTPASDLALLGWWDASDAATLTTNNGAVLSWADKAGGDPLLQSAPSWRPTSGTRNLNGLNVLDFTGNAQALVASRSVPVSGDLAIHGVFVVDSSASAFAAILALDAQNDFQIDANSTPDFSGRLNTSGIGSSVNLTGGPFVGAFILSVILDRTGAATAEIFIGDVSRGSTGYTSPIDSNVALHLMTNRSMNAWIDGAVAEIAITSDLGNRSDYHSYFSNKWGIV